MIHFQLRRGEPCRVVHLHQGPLLHTDHEGREHDCDQLHRKRRRTGRPLHGPQLRQHLRGLLSLLQLLCQQTKSLLLCMLNVIFARKKKLKP